MNFLQGLYSLILLWKSCILFEDSIDVFGSFRFSRTFLLPFLVRHWYFASLGSLKYEDHFSYFYYIVSFNHFFSAYWIFAHSTCTCFYWIYYLYLSLSVNAVLLTSSVNILSFLLLNLTCNFNINLLFFLWTSYDFTILFKTFYINFFL